MCHCHLYESNRNGHPHTWPQRLQISREYTPTHLRQPVEPRFRVDYRFPFYRTPILKIVITAAVTGSTWLVATISFGLPVVTHPNVSRSLVMNSAIARWWRDYNKGQKLLLCILVTYKMIDRSRHPHTLCYSFKSNVRFVRPCLCSRVYPRTVSLNHCLFFHTLYLRSMF